MNYMKNLSIWRNKVFELKNVKFKDILNIDHLLIDDSGLTMIIGPSGSGKSTLIKMLDNIISPDSGEILYKSDDINTYKAHELRRKVIMQSQFPAIFEGNLRDNLNVARKFSKLADLDDEKLNELLGIVLLDKKLDDDPKDFSGGEKTRLSIARVLAMDSEVYLFDEPTSSLDDDTECNLIENVIKYLKEKNKKIIMVSHSEKLFSLANQIVKVENKTARIKEA